MGKKLEDTLQELGPDWRNLGRRPKTTHSPKIMTSTTPTTMTLMPKTTVAWTPRMTTTHEPRTKSTKQSSTTAKVQPTTTKSSTPTTTISTNLPITISTKADVTLMSSTMPTTRRTKLLPSIQISSTLQTKPTRQPSIKFTKTVATTALKRITSTASTVILRSKVTSTKPPTAAVTSSPPTTRATTPTTTLSSTDEAFPRKTTSTIAGSDGANSAEKIIQEEFNKRKMIHRGRNRSAIVEPTTKNETHLKMVKKTN